MRLSFKKGPGPRAAGDYPPAGSQADAGECEDQRGEDRAGGHGDAGFGAAGRLPRSRVERVVEKVSEYPAATSWFNSSIKEYETLVRIETSVEGMRPGLTAEVKIRVAHLKDVLQVPVRAVLEHGDRHYCSMFLPGALKPDRGTRPHERQAGRSDPRRAQRGRQRRPQGVGLSRQKSLCPSASMPQSQAPAAATEQQPAPDGDGASPPGLASRPIRRPRAGRPAGSGRNCLPARQERRSTSGSGRVARTTAGHVLRSRHQRRQALDLNEWTAAAKRFAGRPRKAAARGGPSMTLAASIRELTKDYPWAGDGTRCEASALMFPKETTWPSWAPPARERAPC